MQSWSHYYTDLLCNDNYTVLGCNDVYQNMLCNDDNTYMLCNDDYIDLLFNDYSITLTCYDDVGLRLSLFELAVLFFQGAYISTHSL